MVAATGLGSDPSDELGRGSSPGPGPGPGPNISSNEESGAFIVGGANVAMMSVLAVLLKNGLFPLPVDRAG
ncbi:MAG: hypothetical protein ACK2T0_10220, partial [Anaerolineales bacterium]